MILDLVTGRPLALGHLGTFHPIQEAAMKKLQAIETFEFDRNLVYRYKLYPLKYVFLIDITGTVNIYNYAL